MDVFVASENTFNAAHLSKPKRIVEIPTNAPVQTRHDEVEFSSGTFTFPAATPWRDRFITWRATGTLLILEERSVRHSVIDSCIAFNFSRAPIVPGTTISLLNNLLSVVVTTQSSVHRFMCRLAIDESDESSESVESTLSQLLDVVVSKEVLRADFHDVHQLAARSTPVHAAVAVRPAETRVAVGLSDGQMVVVVMGNGIGGKMDELPVSEAGFMQRFVGKTMTGVMDLCTEREECRRAGDVDFTPFYTVNKDSTIRIVNGETCQTALSVPWNDFTAIDGEVLHASIKWTKCGENGLIVVSITTANSVHFLLLRDLERQQLVRVASSRKPTCSRLIDFGVHEVAGKDIARLWIVAGIAPSEMGREKEEETEGGERREEDSFDRPVDTYTLEYMDLHLPSSYIHRPDSQLQHRLNTQWKRVRGVGETLAERFSLRHKLRQEAATNGSATAASSKENAQMLRREVFNVENNQFDVVLRAVKIATDNSSSLRPDHNDWAGLMAAVDTYIRSSEFERKFGSSDWQTTSVVNTRDVKSEGEMRFYRALSCSCTEISRSMARPLGLFMTPLAGTHLVGVIQETRLTVVVDACGELADRLSDEQLQALNKALEEAKEDEEKSPASSLKEKERKRSRPTYERLDSDEGEEWLSEAVQLFVRRAKRLVNGVETNGREDDEREGGGIERMEDSRSSNESPTSLSSDPMSDEDCCSPYGGSFSAGLISSLLRCRIVDEHKIASRLLRVMEKGRTCLEEYRESLRSIVSTLGILAAQLDVHVERESGGIDSLSGWLFSAQALPLLRIEGGYEIDVNMTGDEDEERPPLHLFINRSVMAVLSAIHPLSPTQSIPKLLAVRDKHDTIKRIYSLWGSQLPIALKYVAAYYNGIALSGTGMPRKALDQFKEAANGMKMGDKMLTRALVPLGLIRGKREQEENEIGIGVFYVNVIKVLNEHGHQQEVIDMSRESMNNLPEGSHLSSINATLFKQQVDGEQWSEALATIESTLDPSLRRHLLHELLSRLLSSGEWQMIISAEFGANTNMVESIILNHARSVDVGSANPHPFELVSAFHVSRNNYYQGALVQYELAVGLRSVPMSPEILMRCKRAVTMTLTLLDLMPEHKRFIAFPHIVSFSSGSRKTMMIVKYEELKREWIMLRGRCALLIAVNSSIPPDEPTALIKALTQAKMYAAAIEMCRVLDEDPSALIEHATTAAISVDVRGEDIMPVWVGANRRLAHKKEKLEHWSVVRGLVKECRERWPKDERSLRAALRAFLAHDIPLPYWLHTKFSKGNAGGYCRLLVDYGGAEAVDTALAVLHECYKREADRIVDADTRTLLPHIVTEEVMEVARKETSPETRMLLDKLESMVRIHQQRATSFATAAKLS
ncbi:hypothetical protein PMAYCL1PPCAC_24429 [Pristionchus mayeri]|uniref:NUP160 middle TPR domain-containing protein n=1 Tax=Pristionchus mayeri TaxID=1317129 RepID=A0AAN5D251_9BILA|nr:hypothetical protein PMAYCL1PPCAC_24429 [Pristionchus mayeri]